MKLKTSYKSKKSTAKKLSKQKLNKKEQKLYELSRNYMDESPSRITNVALDFTKMYYGIIKSCKCDAIIMDDGTITISNSWEEVILKLLYLGIMNNPNNFRELLIEYNIDNQEISVDKMYGKYTFENEQYKAYKIYNTEYYLEAIFNFKNEFNIIAGLLKLNKIPYKNIKFHIINTNTNIRSNIDDIVKRSIKVDVKDIEKHVDAGEEIEAIQVNNDIIPVTRFDVALVAICKYIYDNLGRDALDNTQYVGNTGITVEEDNIELPCTSISDSGYKVYSDLQTDDVIEFLIVNSEKLSIGISFMFKVYDETHEWEIN